MMALIQSTYFGLFQLDELIPTYSALLNLSPSNGPTYFLDASSYTNPKLATISFDNEFLNNFNI
jgi:hypothetical protein